MMMWSIKFSHKIVKDTQTAPTIPTLTTTYHGIKLGDDLTMAFQVGSQDGFYDEVSKSLELRLIKPR